MNSRAAISSAGPAGAQAADAAAPRDGEGNHGLVARNTLALVFSQFVTTPVSIVVNALLARSLGATDFGIIYFAATSLSVVFLFVEWGGQFAIAGEIARDRSRAGEMFAAAVVQRLVLAAVALLLIPRACATFGYDARVQTVLLLYAARLGVASIGSVCSAVFRGFEKIAWSARTAVLGNVLEAAVLIPTLLLGGRLREALIAQLVGCSIAAVIQVILLLRLGIGRPAITRHALVVLVHGGLGFTALDLVIRLQPYIDVHFLSRLARPEAMGWHSAAMRMTAVLFFPANTLAFAIYPTLSRLWVQDRNAYAALVRLGFRALAIIGIFAATGAVLFADVAVDLVYGGDRFAPAAGNLRILAVYILLVYGSIVLGTSIAGAKRQVSYAIAQSLCLVIALALDPLLVPYFERTVGNGGLGVCTSIATAEVTMVAAAVALMPRGVLDRSVLGTLARSIAAAGAMATVGFALRGLPVLAIPLSMAAYAGALWALGGIDAELVDLVRGAFRRKLPTASIQPGRVP